MCQKIYIFSLLICLSTTAWTQPVVKGVSHALALQRHACINQLSYHLSFDIPAEKSIQITASETISFELSDAGQPLQLDFRQDSSHIQLVKVNQHPIPVDLQNEHLVIDQQFLQKGSNTILIEFIAGNESLNRNTDYLYALFVPDRARTVFPCFDQPDLKAVFILSLAVPGGWNVLANADIKDSTVSGSKTIYQFKPSDKLPTYLFSFTAGKFSITDKSGMRFLYRETDTAKIRLSIDSIFQAHSDAIHFLEDWTGIRFPFQKIGFVAVPAFQFGGMEHPGEVQYNAPALFLDNAATKDQLIARSALISHETAHMWFGDMVTMQWFNDVWMKEVFANFMADKVTEKLLGSQTFHLKFLLDHSPAAYNVDRTPGANPIRQELDNLMDAGSLYGNIIYHKAPIMMRQLEMLMGKKAFQKSVQEYLRTYKYGNARWDDLIGIVSKYSKQDLFGWNKVWVNRPGRPVFTYTLAGKQLVITQTPESGEPAVWPETFDITLLYPGKQTTINVHMNASQVSIPVTTTPGAVLFNADGMGYGLFPAFISNHVYQLENPLQRASAYINAYEQMLAGHEPADKLFDFFTRGLAKETNELNLRNLCAYISNVFWNFISATQRLEKAAALESAVWNAMQSQTGSNNKKILFKTYQDIYLGQEAAGRIYNIWQLQKAPDSVKLAEDDYTSLALTIALKSDTANTVLLQQMERISNPDRKARLQFLLPALSPDSVQRDTFFNSLKDISNRRKESWVATALSYMNHPLRQQPFFKNLPAALDMLQELQRTGDIFFPQNWLAAIFSNYQSKEAWQVIDQFLKNNQDYNPRLKAKILQATDNLYRAQRMINN